MSTAKEFLTHEFSTADHLWLESVARNRKFDPRVAKAKLFGKLPQDFDPNHIDRRFYLDNRLTILGIRAFRPDDPILSTIDAIARELKRRILSEPGIDLIRLKELIDATGDPLNLIRPAIRFLSNLGPFFSGMTDMNTDTGPDGVWLTGQNGYDEVLRYEDLDSLLEHWYQATNPSHEYDVLDFLDLDNDARVTGIRAPDSSPKQDTAFVIMAIDPGKPELEDILNAIKEACHAFSIKAYRADEIEHQDRITNVILEEIRNCEYLIADLSLERPNVYYEIGYAHALNKKPILYRKQGTKLHFDLLVHNVPEYCNATELRELIRRRFEAILGRAPNAT